MSHHIGTGKDTKATLKVTSSLHAYNTHPPEVGMNPPKMQCGGIAQKEVSHTTLQPYEMHLSKHNCRLHPPPRKQNKTHLSIQLQNAATGGVCAWTVLSKYVPCFGTGSTASFKIMVVLFPHCFKVLFLHSDDGHFEHTHWTINTYRWVLQCAPQLSYDCLWALSSPGKGTCFPLALGTLHTEDHCTSPSVYAML